MSVVPDTGADPALFAANPFGDSVTLEQVMDDMAFLDDWEDRYRYLIDLGKQLPELPEVLRSDAHLVRGCQSQVWLHWRQAEDGRLELLVDSDAHIVRGLAALVLTAANRRPTSEVAGLDLDRLFGDLDLASHLSPTRGNGLRAMLERIRTVAAGLDSSVVH